MKTKNTLAFLEKKGTIALLLFLHNKQPQRFRDLKKAIPREATLSIRIRETQELALVETISIKDGRRQFFAYKLTQKGDRIASKLGEIA